MFCPNCGHNLPEGTAFCSNCGATLNTQQEAPVQQPLYQTPVYQAPPQYQPSRPASIPTSKKDFLANYADPSTKKSAKLVTISFILTLVLIAASIIVPLSTPFFEIPSVSLLLNIAEADPDELMDEMDDALDEAKSKLKAQKDSMDDEEVEAAEAVVDSMEVLTENFSVLNFKNLVSVIEKEGDDYMDSEDMEEIEKIGQIMDIVIGALIGAFFLPVLFALLGGLNKSTGLTVTALVFTVLSQLTLCGILFVALSLVIFIFQAVQCSKIKTAYDNCRFGRV